MPELDKDVAERAKNRTDVKVWLSMLRGILSARCVQGGQSKEELAALIAEKASEACEQRWAFSNLCKKTIDKHTVQAGVQAARPSCWVQVDRHQRCPQGGI